jgi:porin
VLLTDVLFTQMFSESFGVYFGKLDTLDGDQNAFASGRGITQFLNAGMVFNPVVARTIPYSTLGVGFVVLEGREQIFNFGVLNTVDTASTSGFSELFNNGAVLITEARAPTNFFGRPGHQLIGGTWSSREFVALDQDPRVLLPGNDIPIAKRDGSWCLYWNCDQYLRMYSAAPTRGWGVFARSGVSDANPNPLQSFLSVGIGGDSPVLTRPRDRFGIGYYWAGTSRQLAPLIDNIGDGQGVELFYNYAVTNWFYLTPDLQFIDPARPDVDDAIVVGLRGEMVF